MRTDTASGVLSTIGTVNVKALVQIVPVDRPQTVARPLIS